MEYKLHIIEDKNILTNTSKEKCFEDAKRLGYQLFDIVRQEQVIEEIEIDGFKQLVGKVDESGMPVMHDVTYPATHTFNWGDLADIKKWALEQLSFMCADNRRKKYMSDETQLNALAGIYEKTNNPKKINNEILTKQKAIEIINTHRDFYYEIKNKIDLCSEADSVYNIMDNLKLP